MSNQPQVGLGVIVMHKNKVLLGKRKNTHGAGCWCFPGGHLEFGETWQLCAKREVQEEVGIEIQNIQFGAVTNDIFVEEQKHYVTIFVTADYTAGEVRTFRARKI